jgi:hypothetical protein
MAWHLFTSRDHHNLSKLVVSTGSLASSRFSTAYLGLKLTNLANVLVQFS